VGHITSDTTLYRCRGGCHVTGPEDVSCLPGYESATCGACSTGYARTTEQCVACGATGPNLAASAGLGLLLLGCFSVYVWFALKYMCSLAGKESKKADASSTKVALAMYGSSSDISVFAVISSMTDFMIYVGVLSSVKLSWSDSMHFVLVGVSLASGTQIAHVGPLSCLLAPFSPVVRELLLLLALASTPIALMLLVVLAARCKGSVGFSMPEWRRSSVLVAAVLFQPTVAKQVFALFPTVEIDDTSFMTNNMSVVSGSAERHAVLVLATVVTVVYVAGLPLLLLRVLCDPCSRFAPLLGFMFKSFKPGERYWAVVVVLRKTVLAAVVAVLQEPWQQLYAALWIMALSTIWHTVQVPYAHPTQQRIETASLSAATFIIALSLAIPIGVDQSSLVEIVIGTVELGTMLGFLYLIGQHVSLRGALVLVCRVCEKNRDDVSEQPLGEALLD
jgi:hypothetical protein